MVKIELWSDKGVFMEGFGFNYFFYICNYTIKIEISIHY